MLFQDDPIGQIGHGVKIAQNLSVIDRHTDAVTLAQGLLSFGRMYIRSNEDKSKLNFIVGMAYEEVAYKLWDDHYRQVAISNYQNSVEWEERKNCGALYNIFDLNFQFHLRDLEHSQYLAQARQSLFSLVYTLENHRTNFYSNNIKGKLQAAFKEKREQASDPQILKHIDAILSL